MSGTVDSMLPHPGASRLHELRACVNTSPMTFSGVRYDNGFQCRYCFRRLERHPASLVRYTGPV